MVKQTLHTITRAAPGDFIHPHMCRLLEFCKFRCNTKHIDFTSALLHTDEANNDYYFKAQLKATSGLEYLVTVDKD